MLMLKAAMTSNIKLRIAALSTVAAALSSCALTKDTVALSYAPQTGVQPLSGASANAINVAVTDERAERTKIGTKKNGFGMEMAPIVPQRPVAEFFKSAIEAELKNRGFQLGRGKTLSVEVDRFYNDFKVGMWSGDAVGELEMHVSVGSYRRPIKTSYQHTVMMAGGENVKQSLEGAMQEALQKPFADPAFIAALVR